MSRGQNVRKRALKFCKICIYAFKVIAALEFCAAWLDEDGYSRPLMQWIFALMCAVEKPLDPDVCSSLRCIARFCMNFKQNPKNYSEKEELNRIMDCFICIIAFYFEQRDLVA